MTHTVLVIDDNADVRLFVEKVLRRLGVNVVCASDGVEGTRQYREIGPDLVITDILMPNQDGIGTIRAIRARSSATKIIAMSGHSRMGNIDALQIALKLGADEILTKPFEPEELRAVVSRFLKLQ